MCAPHKQRERERERERDEPYLNEQVGSGDVAALSSRNGSPAAILQTLRDAVKAGHVEVAWTGLLALPAAVRRHHLAVGPAADALGAAIDTVTVHAALSSNDSDTTLRRLATISVNCRLARHPTLEPLLQDFTMMVQIRGPALARTHLGEGYGRLLKSLASSVKSRRLRGTPIEPRGVLHEALMKALQDKNLLRSWEFPDDAGLKNSLREIVDNEGRKRQLRHFTRKKAFRPLERARVASGRRELPGESHRDTPQSGSQETAGGSMKADLEGYVYIHEFLCLLTPDERHVVTLRYAGLSDPEIARRVKLSPATVWRLRRSAGEIYRACLQADRRPTKSRFSPPKKPTRGVANKV